MPAAPDHLADPGKADRLSRGIPVVPVFDGYRALAIIGIVVFHLLGASGVAVAAEGATGDRLIHGIGTWFVVILFIVSGFVVYLPTVARHGEFGSVGAYAIRRAARLMPAFWLAMVIVLVLIAVLPSSRLPFPDAGELLLNFSGQHAWGALADVGFAGGFGVNGPVWTLTLEIGFYVVLPLVAVAYFRHPLVGLTVAAAITIGWREAFAHIGELASGLGVELAPGRDGELRLGADGQLPSWAFAFAAGMTGAWAFERLRGRQGVAQPARIVVLAALGALVLCVALAGSYAVDHEGYLAGVESQRSVPLVLGYTSALAVAMVALSLAPPRWQTPLAHPLVRRLGDISYGVFLIHAVLIWVVALEFGLPQDGTLGAFAAWVAAVLPLSLLYGYLSARFVEQPIRRWARRYGRRAEPTAPATPPEPRPETAGLSG